MKTLLSTLNLIAFAVLTVDAFVITPSITSASLKEKLQSTELGAHVPVSVSRRRVFQSVLTVSTAFTLMTHSSPAFADVTNKVASQSALRYVKRSIKELEKLELYAAENDYQQVKSGLRTPPMTEVRKNANILIRGGEDGQEKDNLIETYASFIKDLEELDGAASLGLRGRKNVKMIESYDKSLKDLIAFAEVAERSTAIPMASGSEQ